MSTTATTGLTPALTELDEIVDHLSASRERAASAFAAEMFFFERIADVVDRRERERGRRAPGVTTSASQLGMREVFAEVGAALRLSEWQVARKVSVAWTLTNRFHETLCEASCGRISPEHATLIAETGAVIDDDQVRREYEAVALDMAGELTSGQLRPALSGLVVRLDPEGTERRVRDAVARRRVTVRELEPGLARITADVPTVQGVGIVERLNAIAAELHEQNAIDKRAVEQAHTETGLTETGFTETGPSEVQPTETERADAERAATTRAAAECAGDDRPGDVGDAPAVDDRTRAQIAADVFCDLLLAGGVTAHGASDEARASLNAIVPTVHVTIPATTLAGATVGGAFVRGFGAVDDDTARHLAGIAPTWTRVFTDPCRGVPIDVDRYRPSKKQRLFLRVRDEQCRFPGCRRPAEACDVDHTVAHAEGGPTRLCNLAHLCARHHTVKHETDWTVVQLPGGVLLWTAPTGRVHVVRPPGTVRFEPVAVADAAPF